MSIKQREDEMPRSYIAHFNKEALSIDEVDDKILVAAFTKYMNAEDALLAREEKPRNRERQEESRQDRGRKIARTRD